MKAADSTTLESLWPQLIGNARDAAPALAGYALVRLAGLAILAVFAARADQSVVDMLTDFDGRWYLEIARNGYDTSIQYGADGLTRSNIAFFPLYPWLIRLLACFGTTLASAGLILAALSGLAAAWGIFLVGKVVKGRSVGILLAVLWGVVPHAIVQNMAYTESLFTAICAWALWSVLTRRWLLAGVLTLLAGLTRPASVVLVGVVGAACGIAILRGRDGWRPWVAAALAPIGLFSFWAWCAVALGRIDAWYWMQDTAWGSRMDFGLGTLRGVGDTLSRDMRLAEYVTTLALAVAIVLGILLIRERLAPWPVVGFALAMLALVLLQGGVSYHPKGRFLIPDFPLLLPLAVTLVKASTTARYLVLGLLTLLSAWYGTYLGLVWTNSP